MIQEFIHEFKGFGRVPSKCKVKIFPDKRETLICFEDIEEGTSVTNASEQLASEIVDIMDLDPDWCRFFETYRRSNKKLDGISYYYDGVDEITYEWEFRLGRWEAKNPEWKSAPEEIECIFTNV